jgi:hypothetical protein
MRDDYTGNWYYLGMETAADRMVESGAMMSPLSVSARGRLPT